MVQNNGDAASSCGSSSDHETGSPVLGSKNNAKILGMRGIQWRIHLGVLPDSNSIDELRRAAANCRRKYAELRRNLLVDPHITDESEKQSDLSLDNPLSQNPESAWGRFFKNAEIEKAIENDLSRLYPEHGSYFQSPECQAMLRRILLLWSLRHSDYSYRQGMHELLAPLFYVLHVDVQHLHDVKTLYKNLFDEKFDSVQFKESNVNPRVGIVRHKKFPSFGGKQSRQEDEVSSINSADTASAEGHGEKETPDKTKGSNELDAGVMSIFLGNDSYGAEGELGALLSSRFLEHDAYCMFDALLSGQGGAVAMANYFVNIPSVCSYSGLPPVIEASSNIYHLLALSDGSLHSHLVEHGVEPQYFALRWLRVLFGREFGLEDLLLVWDAIFASADNTLESGAVGIFGNHIKHSPRSVFISGMAVSMILHLRSSLLATPNATTCLQKLLNFPRNANVDKLIEKAKLLLALVLEPNFEASPSQGMNPNPEEIVSVKLGRSTSDSPAVLINGQKVTALQHQHSGPRSPNKMKVTVLESYWEQKWKNSMLQRETLEEHTVENFSTASETQDKERGYCSPPNRDARSFLNNFVSRHKRSISSGKPTRRKLLNDLSESHDASARSSASKTLSRGDSNKNLQRGGSSSKKNVRNLENDLNEEANQTVVFDKKKIKDNASQIDTRNADTSEHLDSPNVISSQVLWESTQQYDTGSSSSESCTVTTSNSEASTSITAEDVSEVASKVTQEDQHPNNENGLASSKDLNINTKMNDVEKTGINSDESKKLRLPAGGFSSKFRWLWNFGRNNNASANVGSEGKISEEKSSTDVKHRPSEKEVDSEGTISLTKEAPSSLGSNQNEKTEAIQNSTLSVVQGAEGDQAHASEELKASPLYIFREVQEVTTDSVPPLVSDSLEDQSSSESEIPKVDYTADNLLGSLVSSAKQELLANANGSPNNLRSLGQTMLENIQVIESAFSQGHSNLSKEQHNVTSSEKSEHPSMNLLAEKGQAAAFVALTELRKISNILLQM